MHVKDGQILARLEIFLIVTACAGSGLVKQQKISFRRHTCDDNKSSSSKHHIGMSQRPHNLLLRNPLSDELLNTTYLNNLFQGCHDVCNTSIVGTAGKFFNEVRKSVNCMELFSNVESDSPATMWPPPETMPEILKKDYLMGGAVTLISDHHMFFKQRYSGSNAMLPVWTSQAIDELIGLARQAKLNGTYGVQTTTIVQQLIDKYSKEVHGKHMFVIGSEQPWLEALLLFAGAAHVTTIEYGKIRSEDPRISTITPAELREKFIKSGGKEPHFDGGATYSSIEHAGLGRYGDSLNPWGDLQAMAKAWCITKPKGLIFVGVPTDTKDVLYWNAHRVYGPKRWPQLMANWHQLDRAGIAGEFGSSACLHGNACQPMLVAQRMEDESLES